MNNEIENIISHIQPFEDSLLVVKYIEKIEHQNKELIEFTKNMRDIGKLNPERLQAYTDIIYHDANDLIIRIEGE